MINLLALILSVPLLYPQALIDIARDVTLGLGLLLAALLLLVRLAAVVVPQ